MTLPRPKPANLQSDSLPHISPFKRTSLLLAITLALFLLTACAPVIGKSQPVQTGWLKLGTGIDLGQSFVANYDGLSGIQLTLAPDTPGTGKINLHLRSDAQSTVDIAVSSLSVSRVNAPGIYTFFFTPQDSSRRRYYYIEIDIRGAGSVQVGSSAGSTYLDGAAYANSIAQDGQLTFRLAYSIKRLGFGLAREFANWGVIILVGLFLFILPGWGLLKLLWPGWNSNKDNTAGFTWMEKLGLSAGVSLVVYPILLLWTGLVTLHLGWLYAWLPPFASIAVLAWGNRTSFLSRFQRRKPAIENNSEDITGTNAPRFSIRKPVPSLHTIVLLLVVVLLIYTRFWSIRALDAPMWGDSYQHTVITQLIIDHNGLFRSWQPYANLQSFTYHFGFHSASAAFHWVTGLSAPRSVLWVGQIFNILAVLCLYPLALKVCRNRWSGVAALVIAGFLAPVPMSYTNWGRYTQLAGLIVLVSTIYILWTILLPSTIPGKTILLIQPLDADINIESSPPGGTRKAIFLAAIMMGGLAITHLRVLIFAIVFICAVFISYIFMRAVGKAWKSLVLNTVWIGLIGAIIFLPWFINMYGGKILRNFTNQVTTPASTISLDTQNYNAIGSLTQYLPIWIWLLLPLAIALGLWRHHKGIALISLWGYLLLIFANPAWLGLPGTGALSNFAIFIAVYIPAAILLGAAIGMLAEEFLSKEWQADLSIRIANRWKANLLRLGVVGVQQNNRLSRIGNGLLAILLVAISLSSIPVRLNDLQPERYALLTRPDQRATSWIRKNLPSDATLLVNSIFAYGGSLIAGTDGGWWLPVLTSRQATVPPLNYGTERGPQPDYKNWINALPKAIAEEGITQPDVLTMLKERDINYVYIGQQQGSVNDNGIIELDPYQLSNDPHFRTIYHQDRVWIFEVSQTP